MTRPRSSARSPSGPSLFLLAATLGAGTLNNTQRVLETGSRGLLDRAAFAKMRRRPALINVARGGLVVEADLAAALDDGLVRGAALDVLAEDSPDLGHHPLVGRRDVLLTPHVAFYSESALKDLRRISAANIRAFLDGRRDDVFRLVTPVAGAA